MEHHAFLIKSAVRENEPEPKPGLVGPILGGLGAGAVSNLAALPLSPLIADTMAISGINGHDSDFLRALSQKMNVPASVKVRDIPSSRFSSSRFIPGFANATPFEKKYFGFGDRPVVEAPFSRPEFLAHELGHAAGSVSRHPLLLYGVPNALRGVGAAVGGYRAAEGENFWKDIGKGGLHGAIGAGLGGSPVLFEEARASYGALKALKSLSGRYGINPASMKLARNNLLKSFLMYLTRFTTEGAGSGIAYGGIGHALNRRSKWKERMVEERK